jgi:osmotically-inducible protein OsmY
VTVDEGKVMMTGDVPRYSDVLAAREAAWRMEGVVNVADQLRVRYPEIPPGAQRDTDIKARASDILKWEPFLDENSMVLSVMDGVATLEGTVDAYWKKSLAENRLAGVIGIRGIENKLAVAPTRKLSDEAVAKDVVAAMDRDVLVNPEDVTVKVTDGHVKLTGSVPSRVAKDSAYRSAALTYGVLDVENQLRVSA